MVNKAFYVLLKRLIRQLKKGDELTTGNFLANYPSRDYMEAGGWFLHYRMEGEFFKLTHRCTISADSIGIE
ncbi:MAG: hypothetical protein R8K20_00540 [Gallionellaceae bacterium]